MFQQKEFRGTPSAQLRELLGQLEVHIGKLERDSGEGAREIPALFDAADAVIAELQRAGAPLSAEIARFETVSASFRRKARTFLRKVGGIDAFIMLREGHNPEAAQWWWFIDQWVADQSRVQRRRQLKSLLIGAAVLAALAVIYTLFLQPDAATLERVRRHQDAEQFALAGDDASALEQVNAALAVAPGDASLLALKGVLQARLGLEAEATTTFAAAEAASDSREHFFLIRAQAYLSIGMYDAMIADAEAAIAVNPQSARGYLYLAQANANLGNLLDAQMYYEKAEEQARAAGDAELEAFARVQMAYLYQQMMALPTATPQAP